MDRTNGLEQTASTSLSERLHRPRKGDGRRAAKSPSAKRSALTRSRRLNLRRARRGAGGRNWTVAEAEALADWVALHNRNLSNTVAIEVPLMKQWGRSPSFSSDSKKENNNDN
jgi:hypothetical protein